MHACTSGYGERGLSSPRLGDDQEPLWSERYIESAEEALERALLGPARPASPHGAVDWRIQFAARLRDQCDGFDIVVAQILPIVLTRKSLLAGLNTIAAHYWLFDAYGICHERSLGSLCRPNGTALLHQQSDALQLLRE